MTMDGHDVVSSCHRVVLNAKSVSIDRNALYAEIRQHTQLYSKNALPSDWAQHYHFVDPHDLERTCLYVLVLDSMNFCFWTVPGYEYEHLAQSLKHVLEQERSSFDPHNLCRITPNLLRDWLMHSFPRKDQLDTIAPLFLEQLDERCRLLRQVGSVLLSDFEGSALELLRRAQSSALGLFRLITRHFSGFQDHAIYRGRQVSFYKRAQILVGDMWGALRGHALVQFEDIGQLSCFPDYRIPQLLHSWGVLQYSEELERKVRELEIVTAGSEEEMEIRASTVECVELIRQFVEKEWNTVLTAVEIDWILWERGEALLDSLPPHHRTFTIFY